MLELISDQRHTITIYLVTDGDPVRLRRARGTSTISNSSTKHIIIQDGFKTVFIFKWSGSSLVTVPTGLAGSNLGYSADKQHKMNLEYGGGFI